MTEEENAVDEQQREQEKEQRIERLVQLFEILDQDNSGAIDVEEMRWLGKIIAGSSELPSAQETVEQMKMADKNGDNAIDLGEWLEFSTPFLDLALGIFHSTMDEYIELVKTSLLPDIEKTREEKNAAPAKLPPRLCDIRGNSSGKIDIKPSKTESFKKRELQIDIDSAPATPPRSAPMTPSGWFWGTCSTCSEVSKMTCDKCQKAFCMTHGPQHLFEHVENVQQGKEEASSPLKDPKNQECLENLTRIDSRFGFFPDSMDESDLEAAAARSQPKPANDLSGLDEIGEHVEEDEGDHPVQNVVSDRRNSVSVMSNVANPSFNENAIEAQAINDETEGIVVVSSSQRKCIIL